jgi:Lanthionine synthetase C-like protein
MIGSLTETEFNFLEIAQERAGYIMQYSLEQSPYVDNPERSPADSQQWNSPENLDTGMSGKILFLLEMYRSNKEEHYLVKIDQLIEDMLKYCKTKSTGNYSLYTGRGGVVYVMLQRYLLKPDAELLKEILLLVKPVNREYLHLKYTSDYLYDGRAGTLLLLMELYQICGEEFLLGYITEFTLKIIDNVSFSSDGAYWRHCDEIHIRPSVSFAYGSAGILYVLNRLNQRYPNTVIALLIRESARFINNSWVRQFNNWGDFRKNIPDHETLKQVLHDYLTGDPGLMMPKDDISWANGSTGILLAADNEISELKLELASSKIAGMLAEANLEQVNLFAGLAGLGMYYLENEKEGQGNELQQIISQVKNRLAADLQEDKDNKGGLLHGSLGCIYFLLKATNKDRNTENVLFPFSFGSVLNRDDKSDISINLSDFRQSIIRKYYPRTCYFINHHQPQIIQDYFDETAGADFNSEMLKLEKMILENVPKKLPLTLQERVTDVFTYEKLRIEYLQMDKRSVLEAFIEERLFSDQVMQLLNNSDEWLLKQTFIISPGVKFVHTCWNWGYLHDFDTVNNSKMAEKILQSADIFAHDIEHIFQISGDKQVVENFSDLPFRLALHTFDEPITASLAISKITKLIYTLHEKALLALRQSIGVDKTAGEADFHNKLDLVLLNIIRELIHRNMLILKK